MSELNLTTDEARVSYGIGRQLGDQLRENPVPGMTLDAVLAGLSDAFAGIDSRVSGEALSASFQVIRERMQAEAQAKAEAAAGEGRAYGRERQARRRDRAALGPAVRSAEHWRGRQAFPRGYRAHPLPRHPDRRHRIRQLLPAWPAGRVPGGRRDRRLGRSAATDERRLQVAPARTERTGLWRPGRRQHSPHSVLVFDVELLEIL